MQFVIQTSLPYEDLDRMVEAFLAEARKNPNLVQLDSDLKLNKPELKVEMDRDKIADLGLDVATVGRTLETLLGGREVGKLKYSGEQYEVIVKLFNELRRRPEDKADIYVRGAEGAMIPLSNLATIRESVAPRELNRFNQMRAATVSASLAGGYTLGEALAFLEEVGARTLPPGTLTDYNGQSREFKESSSGFFLTFGLAVLFIYLVLAAQFESFVNPMIIILTVPLSITGALIAMHLTGGTLNVYSQMGLVTLIGLITKHGILIVEFANQIQERSGRSVREAVVEAAVVRLRPIVMTTGAMVLGTIPLALATGAGAESREAIGWVVVGGLTFGTLFTLFVVPSFYALLTRPRSSLAPEAEAGPLQAVAAE